MHTIDKMPGVYTLGCVGENKFRSIEIDMTPWLVDYPNGVASIVHVRPEESLDKAYLAATTFENGILKWQIGLADLGPNEGYGQMQIGLYETNKSGEHVGKSVIIKTRVLPSLVAVGDIPDGQKAALDQMAEIKAEVVQTAQAVAEDKQTVVEAKDSVSQDAQAVAEAKRLAEEAKSAAETAQGKSEEAKQAIEDMTVSSETLTPGSPVVVTKTTNPQTNVVNLNFAIPAGETGPQGEIGPQGVKGDKGDPGEDYVITQENIEEIGGMVVESETVQNTVEEMHEIVYGTDKDGNPLPSTNPHYGNNAKYWKEQAAQSATDANTAKQAIEDMTVSATPLAASATPTATKTTDPQTGAVNIEYGLVPGTTYTPSVSGDGTLSFTNDGNKANPAAVNIAEQVRGVFDEIVTGTDPVIVGVGNHRYLCGEVATIDITPSATGVVDVIFTSGTTPTVLTLPATVRMPDWFDATDLAAETVYEINIADGVWGAVMMWAF